ncbi:hypothetical protein L6164_037074 [Bauhinia variegata]|uniref:Uncharacterized protein n=1 Tax=Bauhinia variegata TaxID=167791 RepID=A0ACB9KIV4_BAUVA|nr:hypothetical protein L6164_037074 [Bauhinia variegata]
MEKTSSKLAFMVLVLLLVCSAEFDGISVSMVARAEAIVKNDCNCSQSSDCSYVRCLPEELAVSLDCMCQCVK